MRRLRRIHRLRMLALNMRLKLPGALVLKEAVVSCFSGHGTSSTTCCAGGPLARSLSAIR